MAELSWLQQACLATLLIATAGCEAGFPPPSELRSLRVLAVRPEPASGVPGGVSHLELLAVDADQAAGALSAAPRPLQIAWLGGCHNPPSRQFFACYPLLQRMAQFLAPKVIETDTSGVPPGLFGVGPSFELSVPEDILSGAPRAPGDPIHFGVSYAFFGVCAGELRPDLTAEGRVPFTCVDPVTNQAVDHRGFVTGFTTVYSYEGELNHNPELVSFTLEGADVTQRDCESDEDCADWGGAAEGARVHCSPRGTCALRIARCGESCAKLLLLPRVSASSDERVATSAHEVMWANYYATAGKFDTPTQLVNEAKTGLIADPGAFYTPPRVSGPARIWMTLHDQRGGATWQSLELDVTE